MLAALVTSRMIHHIEDVMELRSPRNGTFDFTNVNLAVRRDREGFATAWPISALGKLGLELVDKREGGRGGQTLCTIFLGSGVEIRTTGPCGIGKSVSDRRSCQKDPVCNLVSCLATPFMSRDKYIDAVAEIDTVHRQQVFPLLHCQ